MDYRDTLSLSALFATTCSFCSSRVSARFTTLMILIWWCVHHQIIVFYCMGLSSVLWQNSGHYCRFAPACLVTLVHQNGPLWQTKQQTMCRVCDQTDSRPWMCAVSVFSPSWDVTPKKVSCSWALWAAPGRILAVWWMIRSAAFLSSSTVTRWPTWSRRHGISLRWAVVFFNETIACAFTRKAEFHCFVNVVEKHRGRWEGVCKWWDETRLNLYIVRLLNCICTGRRERTQRTKQTFCHIDPVSHSNEESHRSRLSFCVYGNSVTNVSKWMWRGFNSNKMLDISIMLLNVFFWVDISLHLFLN